MARQVTYGGCTNAANAEYRGLQWHLPDVHGFEASDLSGKPMCELEELHAHVHRAEAGELPLEEAV